MDDARILDVWSQGRTRPSARRRLLLASVCPGTTQDELARLPVGRCNALLLRDRQATFGSRLDAEAHCPACGERLELTLDIAELLGPDDTDEEAADAVHHVRHGDVALPFRLPTAGDIERAAACPDVESATRVLLRACLTDHPSGAAADGVDGVPAPDILQALDAELRRRDRHADLRVRTGCPGCTHTFELALEPAALYWEELAERARCLLADVHRLAGAYGWSEQECLGLDPVRRAGYLELIG
ncbi:hypothetical protein [Streptomyces sp. NPDC001657]|uniref:T4 family baseplate hub assembly chaperone n=1 Tax=Streptomyces sp. NPDC001657 TaxID=3154522 RepID=UPI003321153D